MVSKHAIYDITYGCIEYGIPCLESSWQQARISNVKWSQKAISKLQNSCGAFLEWAFSLMDHNTGNRNHKEGTLATLPTTITLQTYGKRVGNGEGLLATSTLKAHSHKLT